jgi:hypothetical protein
LKLLVTVIWGFFPESVPIIIEDEYVPFLVMIPPRNLT